MPLSLYLIFIPITSVVIGSDSGHDFARLMELWLVCCYAGWALVLPRACGATAKPSSFGRAWLLTTFLVALVCVISAKHKIIALREFALLGGLIYLTLAVTRFGDVSRSLLRIMILAHALYVSLVFIIIAADVARGEIPARFSLFVGYDNYRFYNHVQTVALPILIFSAYYDPARSVRLLAAASLVAGGLLLLISQGRGTMVSIAVFSVVFITLANNQRRRLAFLVVSSFTLACILFWVIFVWWSNYLRLANGSVIDYYGSQARGDQGRLYLYSQALNMLSSNPLVGTGPMTFGRGTDSEFKSAHPHNIILQIAAEWGVPLAFLLCFAGIWILRSIWLIRREAVRQDVKTFGGFLLALWVAVLVDGMVSGNFVMPVSQVWIAAALVVSLSWIFARRNTGAASVLNDRYWGWDWWLVKLPLCLIFTSHAVWSSIEYDRLSNASDQLLDVCPAVRVSPRFWSDARLLWDTDSNGCVESHSNSGVVPQ